MSGVEVIVVTAAVLWIGVVVVALIVGIRVTLKLRARRRRIDRLIFLLRLPASYRSIPPRRPRGSSRRGPGSMNEMTKIIASSVKMARAERRSPH